MRCTVATLVTFVATAAHACPFCNQPSAQAVRAEIFNEAFWSDVAVLATPFAVTALVVVVLWRSMK